MAEPDHVVFRGTGTALDGRWIDRATLPGRMPNLAYRGAVSTAGATFDLHPTGELEMRDDGAVAEVWAPGHVDWIVIRGTDTATDGQWFERDSMTDTAGNITSWRQKYPPSALWPEGREVYLVPTMVFEERDGAVGQVWAPEGWTPVA